MSLKRLKNVKNEEVRLKAHSCIIGPTSSKSFI